MSTRYNTGNPIESSDVRDMSDNAKNFDEFSNSSAGAFTDRIGVWRKTIRGMESEFDETILGMGFGVIGKFSTGATLVNPRQTLLWDIADGGDGQEYGWSGTFPKTAPPLSNPDTSGGIGSGAWLSRFDPTLRVQTREMQRRSYAEAGLTLAAGSFEVGGMLTSESDVLLQESSGKAFGWAGAFPKVVAAGSGTEGFSDKSPLQAGAGVVRNYRFALRDFVSVKDFGAKGDGESIDKPAFDAAFAYAQSIGGCKIYIPAGTYLTWDVGVDSSIYWVGDGIGSTTLTQPNGNNKDIIKSRGFDTLTGVGPLADAPIGFGFSAMTIDGNYLADYKLASIGGDTTKNNSLGFGMRLFGSKYTIDVEIVNCAQVGFYSEAFDYTGYGDEQSCHVNLTGRVFGKEAVIFRGPADIEINRVFMGAAAWLPTLTERQSVVVMSDIFAGEPVHVMVSDETGGYHGHHEFNIMHLYGNLSGYGYKMINTGRLKGNHLICENCRGGFSSSSRAWGGIAMLECHSNGRLPKNAAGVRSYHDILNLSRQGFTINAVVRRSKGEGVDYVAYKDHTDDKSIVASSSRIVLNYFSLTDSETGDYPVGPVASIAGENSVIDVTAVGVNGDCVISAGIGNTVKVNAMGVSGAAINRIAGATSGNAGNSHYITAKDVGSCVYLDGLVYHETFKINGTLNTGQSVIAGTNPDLITRNAHFDVVARIGTAAVGSKRRGKVSLANDDTTAKTITIDHGFFMTPDAALISSAIYDPPPLYSGKLEYIYLQAITAQSLTFAYKLASVGTGGPLVLTWGVG